MRGRGSRGYRGGSKQCAVHEGGARKFGGTLLTDISTPQAGWYPDPTDSRVYRWWSGGAWTEHLTAAPTSPSAWSDTGAGAWTTRGGADPSAVTESSNHTGSNHTGTNRAGAAVVIIGVVAIAAYLGSIALAYSTVLPLIPGVVGLVAAVPAFRRARVTGEGLAISLLGVLLSGAATVLSVIPLLPMLLGIPSSADVDATTGSITQAITFHTTVQQELVAGAQKDFAQPAVSATCPSDALPAKGSTFTCTETLADGSSKLVNVTVTDDSGTVTWVTAVG